MQVLIYEATWPVGEAARPFIFNIDPNNPPTVIRWRDRTFVYTENNTYREAESTLTINANVVLPRG